MYIIISNVIKSGNYELNDMLRKIDTIWVQGSLTDEERGELVELAQSNADPARSYAPIQEQINQAFDRIKALEGRMAKLEAGEEPEPEEWPEWYKWDGFGPIPWQNGSKCIHNDQKYISQVANNIWEPGAVGVYDNIWKPVE